jgi:peptide deformylase
VRQIVEYPNGALLKKCAEVQYPYIQVQPIVEVLKFHCTSNSEAVGLAANQVGIMERIIVFKRNDGQFEALINPKIIDALPVKEEGMEGCLSLPGLQMRIFRSVEVTVEALNENLQPVTLVAEGMEARIIQHEIDHLDGILITDHRGKLNRQMALDKWMKLRKKLDRAEMAYLNRSLKKAA